MTTLPRSKSGRDACDVAAAAAKAAGEILKAHFREETRVSYKGKGNIVTEVDLWAESSLISLLQAEYPGHGILSEESRPISGDSGYTWILDPLDGTNNYSFGMPFFCVVLALTRGDDVLLGVVYDPLRDELFHAEKGKGAFLNNRAISVSGKKTAQESLVGFDLGYVAENGKTMLEFIAGLWPNLYALRVMGSAALGMAYTACGRLDLYFHLLLYPWELACGQLLVAEAGGVATDWKGKPVGVGQGPVVAANKSVHTDFLRLIHVP